MESNAFVAAMVAGWNALGDYLVGKILGAFIPAFFLAGAIGSWIPKSAVVKYLSPGASRFVAYPMATIAGGLLSVCSCGILPLFTAVYTRGAGIGPAMTFLFAGPAINLIAIYYTFDILGTSVGVARIVSVVALSVVVGLVFELLFEDRSKAPPPAPKRAKVDLSAGASRKAWQTAFPMLWMAVATVVLPLKLEGLGRRVAAALGLESVPEAGGAAMSSAGSAALPAPGAGGWLGGRDPGLVMSLAIKWGVVLLALTLIVWSTRRWFTAEEREAWLEKTWFLASKIIPKVVLGIFLTGILESWVDRNAIADIVGDSSLRANAVASLAGGVLYFGTIVGVVVARSFQVMGMADGPLLALLIAGPTVTLPSVLAITGVIGWKRSAVYFTLVVVLAMGAGMAFGALPR